MAVGAFITVPFGPVPFTLQTLILLLAILVLTPGESLVAVGGYLLIGTLGLPVGAGFRGGIAWLLGPTGGFLMGYLVATAIVAGLRLLLARTGRSPSTIVTGRLFCVLSAAIVMLTYYTTGTLWYCFVSGNELWAALAACVFPFLLPDVLKAVAAAVCAQPVLAALGRLPWAPRRKVGE
jgi:biotin transport system substrate-specific component